MSNMFDAVRHAAEDAHMPAPAPNSELRDAAEQFEAIFLNQFLKQARSAKLAEDLFGSNAKSTYEEMLDREYSNSMAGQVNLGIAEALIRQCEGQVK
ncbi:MAG: rod-binding protein [Bacteroidetes bacterium]|nr:rod-binding protein [Bacteroidota bacterium]